MLRAVGFGDGDFEKPIVGVANGHSTMNPCNAGIQPLVDRAMAALKEAGAMPQVFGIPTVTDGIGMGTEGMKYSLVSREVIADAIETSVNGAGMDGVLVVGGCDKNMPGGMMAMARMNVPGIYVYARHDQARQVEGPGRSRSCRAFEAVGAYAAGKMTKEDFDGIERNACPSVGACGGMYTANTMSSSFEALGMSLLGSSQMASPDPREGRLGGASAQVLVDAIRDDLRPRDIITRKSIENAITLVMATGGSTNAVLHYLAIAHAADVKWTIDDFERDAAQARAGAVRPQALGPLRRDRFPPGRRRAAGAEDAARSRAAARRLHDDHRAHDRRGARCGAARAARGPGSDPAVGPADVPARPPRDPQGQPRDRRLRGQDHRTQEPVDHRPRARVRLRAAGDGGDPREADQAGGRRS